MNAEGAILLTLLYTSEAEKVLGELKSDGTPDTGKPKQVRSREVDPGAHRISEPKRGPCTCSDPVSVPNRG